MPVTISGTNGVTFPDSSLQAAAASPNVLKNRLVNGSFGIAQRGTSFTSTSSLNNDDTYNLDRWFVLSDGNDIVDITQETSTVPTNELTAIALDVETINKKFGIAQIIEQVNCTGAIGNTVTLSFQAKVSATTKLDNVKCAIVAWSGTADSVTSDIISAWGAEGTNPTLIANATYENTPVNLNLTTSYATYSVSAVVDTSSTKNIIVFIWSDVTDTTLGDFLYITNAQLEVGSTATPFERRLYGHELINCQRYCAAFTITAINTFFGSGFSYNSTNALAFTPMPVTMRTSPTVTYSTTNQFGVYDGSAGTITTTAIEAYSMGPSGIGTRATVASGLTAGQGTMLKDNGNTSAKIICTSEL
jgi:hypothetical protein